MCEWLFSNILVYTCCLVHTSSRKLNKIKTHNPWQLWTVASKCICVRVCCWAWMLSGRSDYFLNCLRCFWLMPSMNEAWDSCPPTTGEFNVQQLISSVVSGGADGFINYNYKNMFRVMDLSFLISSSLMRFLGFALLGDWLSNSWKTRGNNDFIL